MSRAVISILAVVFSSAVLLLATVAPASAQGRTLNGLLTRAQGDVNRFWSQQASQRGFSYSPPSVYLIGPGQAVRSGCGGAPIQWHTYCASERRIYLDVSSSRPTSVGSLWASNRDFSIVQILAHEWGHHLQALRGILGQGWPRSSVELQAECLSGLFTQWARVQGYLDPGDYEEAIWILSIPGSPTHGTAQQRVVAFQDGFSNPARACGL